MTYELQLIETAIVLGLIIVIKLVFTKLINKRSSKSNFSPERKVKAIKSINGILILLAVSLITSIWSVDQGQVWAFVSSIVTVLGVAFFAVWSHLSNITSGVILFFSQNMKIGDTISILEKDFEIKGKIMNIELMFVVLETEKGETISIPNNFFLQKPIRVESVSN